MSLWKYILYFSLFYGILLSGCNTFDKQNPELFTTYIKTVGGNGYDLCSDIMEVEDAYLLIGAIGPQCDIVDAFMTKVDKKSGSTINRKTFGNTNQSFEENFFSLAHIQNKFMAVGFKLKTFMTSQAGLCSRVPGDLDGKLFLGIVDENFNNSSSHILEFDSIRWDSGFDIVEIPEGGILIAGAWNANIAVLQLADTVVSKVIRSNQFIGNASTLFFHSNGNIYVSGEFIAPPSFDLENIYFAQVDLENQALINERTFSFENRGGWNQSKINAIVETPEGHLLMAGLLRPMANSQKEQAFILKLDQDGNELLFKKLDLGSNDAANDMIAVDDGYIITGKITVDSSISETDALILKIDGEGNIIWQVNHDLRGNDEWTESIIRTEDGGLLTAGRTVNAQTGIQTILLIKTDAEGKIE